MTTDSHRGFAPLWLSGLVLLGLFIIAYWVPLRGMVHVWQANEDYSYGYMIPLVALYLLWDNRSALRSAPIRSSWAVFPILIMMLFVSLYGILGSSGNIAMPAVPILIILFCAFCFGVEFAKRALLPFGFLIFMVPIPAVLERSLGVYLKSVSSVMGGAIVRACGIPVFVSGNLIDLGVTRLQVVDACNGLRYLFPLLAIGILYAYFFEKVTWKRLFCVFATMPIAVLINGLRIGLTGILANWYGVAAAEGFFHDFAGWAMFMVAFFFLFLLGKILTFFPPKGKSASSLTAAEKKGDSSQSGSMRSLTLSFVTAAALLLFVATLSWSTSSMPAVKLRGGIASFPLTIGDWHGSPDLIDPDIINKSGAEEAFSARYINKENEYVSLYIGYRSTAFLETENFFHSPTVCLPSSGQKISTLRTRTISSVPHWGTVDVTEMVTEDAGTRLLVYFWFETKSRETPDKNINRFHLTLHALSRDNTYDLFFRPIIYLKDRESVAEGEKRLDRFVRELSPAARKFMAERIS